MSLNPPKPRYVGQIWVDPITAERFVWTGKKVEGDAWKGWEPWKPQPKMSWEEARAIEDAQYEERNP